MPYIDQKTAVKLLKGEKLPTSAGELNYVFSEIAAQYIRSKGLSYQTLNDVSGALTECLAELRRRIVVPYEDHKRASGADPYHRLTPGRGEAPSAWVKRVNAPLTEGLT